MLKPTRDLVLIHNAIIDALAVTEHPSIVNLIDSRLSDIAERTGEIYLAPELITKCWGDYVHELYLFKQEYKFASQTNMAILGILADSHNRDYYSARFPQI